MIGVVSGMFCGFFISIPFEFGIPKTYWVFCSLFGLIFVFIRLLILFKHPEDTPQYHLLMNKPFHARKILEKIYPKSYENGITSDKDYENVLDNLIKQEKELLNIYKKEQTETFEKKKSYKGAYIGIYLWFMHEFGGVNSVGTYSSQMYRQMGSQNLSVLLTATWGLSGLLAISLAALYVEKTSRRFMIVFGGVVDCTCLALVALSVHHGSLAGTCIALNMLHMGNCLL